MSNQLKIRNTSTLYEDRIRDDKSSVLVLSQLLWFWPKSEYMYKYWKNLLDHKNARYDSGIWSLFPKLYIIQNCNSPSSEPRNSPPPLSQKSSSADLNFITVEVEIHQVGFDQLFHPETHFYFILSYSLLFPKLFLDRGLFFLVCHWPMTMILFDLIISRMSSVLCALLS